jgi:micrococcal nuclease
MRHRYRLILLATVALAVAGWLLTGRPAEGQDVRVIRVIDGDTIVVEGDVQVRYIGIDTPEITGEPQCYGPEASEANRALVEGRRVRLVADERDADDYGRLLRYVYADGVLVNLKLVSDGYARTLAIPPDMAHFREFRDAQERARSAGIGRWSACAR